MSTYTQPVSQAIPEIVRGLVWFAAVCLVAFLVRSRVPRVQCRDALVPGRGQSMLGFRGSLLRARLRQRFLRSHRAGARLAGLCRDIPGIQADQHVTRSNVVAGFHAYFGNRRNDPVADLL